MTKLASDNKAVTIKKTLSRYSSLSIEIQADKSIMGALHFKGSDYLMWNSTLISKDGTITQGGKIQLISTLDSKNLFKLSVKEFEAGNKLVWRNAMGKRICKIKPIGNGLTNFSMNENN